VLEIGFLTQDMDLGNWGDSSVIVPFLNEVEKVDGIAHFLFHQVHIHNHESVREALRKVVREAKSRGFEFWLAGQVYEWEQARRKATILGVNAQGEAVVQGAPAAAVIWLPVVDAAVDAEELELRYGVPCRRLNAVSGLQQPVTVASQPGKPAMGE
jgi:hypothetical protein